MKVNGRQLDFGLNIVIVIANALVVYLVVARNQKTPGNQPVTKPSFWLETNKNCSRPSKDRPADIAWAWPGLDLVLARNKTSTQIPKIPLILDLCVLCLKMTMAVVSWYLSIGKQQEPQVLWYSCSIVVLVHLSILIPLKFQLIVRLDLHLMETGNWILMDVCWVNSSSWDSFHSVLCTN